MLPNSPGNGLLHGGFGDAEPCHKIGNSNSTFPKMPHLSNFIISQFSIVVSRTASIVGAFVIAAIARQHVCDVILWRSPPKMVWVATWRVIAGMKSMEIFSWTVKKLANHTMRADKFSVEPKFSVSKVVARPSPLPAIIFPFNFYAGPKRTIVATINLMPPFTLEWLLHFWHV